MATHPWCEASHDASQFHNARFQRALAHWNRRRLAPGFPAADWQRRLDEDVRMQRLEGAFVEELRAEIAGRAATAPTDVDGFLAWFEELEASGPGLFDIVFSCERTDETGAEGIPALQQ